MDTFIAGAWRTPVRGEIYIGGAWRRLTRGEMYVGDAWHATTSFTPALSLGVTPEVFGYRNSAKPTPGTVRTEYATATPTGGSPPFTYLWTITSGTASITSPTQASTTFSAFLGADQVSNATAHVICTDGLGASVSGDTDIEFSNMSDFSGG